MKAIKFIIALTMICSSFNLFAQGDTCPGIPILVNNKDVLFLTITKNINKPEGTYELTLRDMTGGKESVTKYIPQIEYFLFKAQMKNLLTTLYNDVSRDTEFEKIAIDAYIHAHTCVFEKESDEPTAGIIRPNKYIYVFKDLTDDSISGKLTCIKVYKDTFATLKKIHDNIIMKYSEQIKLLSKLKISENLLLDTIVDRFENFKKEIDSIYKSKLSDTDFVVERCRSHYFNDRCDLKEDCPFKQYRTSKFKNLNKNKKKYFIPDDSLFDKNKILNADFRKKELRDFEVAKKHKDDSVRAALLKYKTDAKSLETKFKDSKDKLNTLIKDSSIIKSIDKLLVLTNGLSEGNKKEVKAFNDSAKQLSDNVSTVSKLIDTEIGNLKKSVDTSIYNNLYSRIDTGYKQFTMDLKLNKNIDSIIVINSSLKTISELAEEIKSTQTLEGIKMLKDSLTDLKAKIIKNNESLSAIVNIMDLSEVFNKIDSTILKLDSIDKKLSKNAEFRISTKSRKNNNLLYYRGVIDKIEYQFQEGQLENIKAYVIIPALNDEQFIFENSFAMPFTTKGNFANLTNYKLYDKSHSYTIFKRVLQSPKQQAKKRYYSIFTGDLFTYDYAIENYTRDYSPKDQVITTIGNSPKEVKKDNSKELFEMKLYTDLFGIVKDKPNGLIQMEVDKRIAFVTKRFQKNYTINQQYNSFNWSYFSYVKPGLTISKIENKQRRLPINSSKQIINNQLYKELYATSIDIMNYESFSIHTDLNLFLLDFPEGQMTIYINAGFKYGLTLVTDSSHTYNGTSIVYNDEAKTNDFIINAFQVYPKLVFRFFPEKRYGFSISYQPSYYKAKSNQVAQVYSYSPNKLDLNKLDTKYATGIQTLELNAYFQPSSKDPNGKIFFRYRFHSQFKDINTNFSQIQLGYSYYFTKR